MKKDDYWFEAMTQISDEKIEEAASYKPRKNVITWKKALGLAACVVLAVAATAVVGGMQNGFFKRQQEITTSLVTSPLTTSPALQTTIVTGETGGVLPNLTEGETVTEIVVEPTDWASMSITQRYPQVEYDGNRYCNDYMFLAQNQLETVLQDDVSISGTDVLTQTVHTETVTLYKINGISSKLAVAVKFKDWEAETYCVYFNQVYTPADSVEFAADISLESAECPRGVSLFVEIEKDTRYYSGDTVAEKLYELLSTNRCIPVNPATVESSDYDSCVLVTLSTECMNFFVQVSSNGIVSFSTHTLVIEFDIGKEVCKEFFEYVASLEQIDMSVFVTEAFTDGTTTPYNPDEVQTTAEFSTTAAPSYTGDAQVVTSAAYVGEETVPAYIPPTAEVTTHAPLTGDIVVVTSAAYMGEETVPAYIPPTVEE